MRNATSSGVDDLAKLQTSSHAVAAWQQAQQHLLAGRNASALSAYRSLTRQFPGAAQLWAECALAAAGELDFALSRQASQRAAELASSDADMLVSIGEQCHRLRRIDEASACYEGAVKADPSSVHARLSLAAWLERCHKLDAAWESVAACLAQHPTDSRALYFKAFLLHRKGLNTEAETALRDLLKSNPANRDVRLSATHLLGVVLDALGQYEEAPRMVGEAKTMLRQMVDTAALEQAYDKMDRARRELLAALTPDTVRRWREEPASESAAHRMVFLGGSPRSGTTLIEQVLGAHPQVAMFDEPESFAQEILNPLCAPPPARALTLKTLNALTSTERQRLTGRYFKSLLRAGAGDQLLLDKNPSLLASLHVWLRLFPQLTVIITLRDPRDIIISCYFQNLRLTAANVNFLGLERTARFYADCMDVWLRLRDLGGFEWVETRYEDIVANLEAEGRRVTGFLGLPWRPEQAAYHEAARRKFVFAPTYSDVAKPVYGRAVRRWEHYAAALAPLEGRLEPYFKAFGYAK